MPPELLQEVDTELCTAGSGATAESWKHPCGKAAQKDCRWEPRTILHWTKQLLILFLCCGRSVPYNSQGGSYRERDIRHGEGKSRPKPCSWREAGLGG